VQRPVREGRGSKLIEGKTSSSGTRKKKGVERKREEPQNGGTESLPVEEGGREGEGGSEH